MVQSSLDEKGVVDAMKVERPTVKGPMEAYHSARSDRPAPKSVDGGQGPVQVDRVDLSSQAQEVGALRVKLREVPESRADLVARLKAQLEAGVYRIKTEELADRLLRTKVLDA